MKRSIGIDISGDKVRMVQLCHGRGRLSVERVHVQEIASTAPQEQNPATNIQSAIKAVMTQEGFDKHATVVAAMPPGRVFFHNLRTELADSENVRQLLKFELEDDFPIPFDDVVADICSCREPKEHRRDFLVAAVSRSELHGWVKTLTEAGIECSVVTADVCALHTAVALNDDLISKAPSFIIYVDGCRTILAATERRKLVCVRYLSHEDLGVNQSKTSTIPASAIAREIELTRRAVFDASSAAPIRILLGGNNKLVHDLSQELAKQTDCEIVVSNPFAQVGLLPGQHVDGELTIALGLALMGADRREDKLDFLAAETLNADQRVKTKRSAIIFALLLFGIGALLIGNLFIQLRALENERQYIKQQIREAFVQTFPEEKRIVNEFAQMSEKLETLRAQCNTLTTAISNRTSPLRILQDISEKITPTQNISVSNISITAESVRLSGTATSFESVDNVINMLRRIPEFETVEPQSIDMDPRSGSVRFSLLITMAQT